MKYKIQMNGDRMLSAIIIAAATVSLCMPALAVEDGLGTNVVKNLRVQPGGSLVIDNSSPGGSITLNGHDIFDWNDLIDEINYESSAVLSTLSNKVTTLEANTNALNTAVTNETVVRDDADGVLQDNINDETAARIAADAGISNTIQSVSNVLDGKITGEAAARNTSDIGISNVIESVSNALNTAKYDKTGGPISGDMTISGDVTMSNKVVYTPGEWPIPDNNTTVSVAQAVVKIGNNGTAVTFSGCEKQIADGTVGQFLTILCTNDAPIMLNDGKGVKLVNQVSFSMNSNDVMQLFYDGANWIETYRADN